MLIALVVPVYVVLAFCFVQAVMRIMPKRIIKSLFIGSFICFIIINMNLFLHTGDERFIGDEVIVPVLEQKPQLLARNDSVLLHEAGHSNASNATRAVDVSVPYRPKMLITDRPMNLTRADDYVPIGSENLTRIQEFIQQANQRQQILNLDKYDLLASDNTIVIVVQVHNRMDYLKYLIESLAKAKDIHQTLLIFSHDWFDDDMNQLVRSIDFCPVMQIFYPVMMQLHPHEFPGESPDDCPRDMKKDEAVKTGCINANSPDKYGHYREAKYTQTKHHWFWKLNHVFDYLDVTKNFHGPVLLIEEDHYMVEDFVSVLRLMYRLKEQTCKDCSIFTLGTYDKRPQYHATSSKGLFERLFGNGQEKPPVLDKVDVMNWISSKHNMGMSLNREVWEQIKKCSKPFCDFDDYNWDWSLQHVSMQCMPSKIRCMVMKSPRIFHIGECGVHHKGKNCDPGTKVRQIQNMLAVNRDKLFPDGLIVAGNPRTPNRMPKPNGGWGDFRDRQLCASFATAQGHR